MSLFSKRPYKAGPPGCRWGNQIFRSDNFSSRRFFTLINLFLAVLGLCCCMCASSSCRELRLLYGCGAWASYSRGFSCCSGAWSPEHMNFSSCSSRALAQQFWHMGFLAPQHVGSSRPGIKPMSSALVGGFLTTGPPGKSKIFFFSMWII